MLIKKIFTKITNKVLKIYYEFTFIDNVLISILTLLLIMFIKQKPSVWSDEYLNGIGFINASDFPTLFKYILSYAPQVAPFYFFIFYLFCGEWGLSIEAFRWVIIFFNLVSVNFVYLIARCFLPRKYALVTSIIFILSPLFLWCAPMLRYHGAVHMFTLLSLYLFFKYFLFLHKINRYTLFALICVNILLVLSHYLFVWVIGFEILIFLLEWFRRKYDYFIPIVLNSIVFILTFLYLTYVSQTNKFLALSFQPTFWEILEKIFGFRDFEVPSYVSWSVFIQPYFVPNAVPSWLQKICEIAPKVISNIGGISIAFILFLLFIYTLYKISKNFYSFDKNLMALFILAFVFPIVFAVYSLLTNADVLVARYLLPCYIARICFLFIILYKWTPPKTLFKKLLIIFIIIWALHQYLLFRVDSLYTDWKKCIQYVEKNINEDDIVICGTDIDTAVFKYNWETTAQKQFPIIFTTDSLDTMADFLVFLIKNLSPTHNICVVYNTQWNYQIEPTVSNMWNKLGLQYTMREFPSWEGLLCYVFSIKENIRKEKEKSANITETIPLASDNSLLSLLKSNSNRDFDEQEKAILARYENFVESVGLVTPIHITLDLISVNKTEWAKTFTKHFQHLNVWFTFAYALAEQDDIIEADKIFQQAKRQNPYFAYIFLPIWEAFKKKDYLTLKKETQRLTSDGYFPSYLFYHFASHKTDNTICVLPLGVFPFETDAENRLNNMLLDEPNNSKCNAIEKRYEEVIELQSIRNNF